MSELNKITGKPQIGTARCIDGNEFNCIFELDADRTYVELHAAEASLEGGHFTNQDNIYVRTADQIALTFLDNVRAGSRTIHGPSSNGSVTRYQPHIVVVGREKFNPSQVVDAVELVVDDAPWIFFDTDAFSVALDANKEARSIIRKQSEKLGRDIEAGEWPILAYFTGKFEILAAETSLGRISVQHRPSSGLGGPRGISIDNTIVLRIELANPLAIRESFDSVHSVMRFLQLVAGRRQNLTSLRAIVGEGRGAKHFDVLWCMASKRIEDTEQPRPDLPVNGGLEPKEFSQVISGWLNRDEKYRDARVRFAEAFSLARSYSTDRLISAANMFDILPEDCFETRQDFDQTLEIARDNARVLFKALPPSDIRNEALGALGRLNKQNLKSKVLGRAEPIIELGEERFKDLCQVLRDAVDSRNHFVHGHAASSELAAFYWDNLAFHVDALEFVFGTSDLVEAGWDFRGWLSKRSSLSHPFGGFVFDYRMKIADYLKDRSRARMDK